MPAIVTEKPPRREVIAMLGDAVAALDALLDDARRAVSERVMVDGRVVSRRFDSEQRATHGLAWLAT
jgi:(2S)-methylsuccinyl-CoA dehydrogenase